MSSSSVKCSVDGCELDALDDGLICLKHDLMRRITTRGGVSRSPLWVMVCEPRRTEGGRADSFLVAWTGVIDAEVNAVGSMLASDYGLDDVPGHGLWVIDGHVKISSFRCNHPLDPEEWDTNLDYEGTWRRPTPQEMAIVAEGGIVQPSAVPE